MTAQNDHSAGENDLPSLPSGLDNFYYSQLQSQEQQNGRVGSKMSQVELPNPESDRPSSLPLATNPVGGFGDRSQTFWGYILASKIAERTGITIEHCNLFCIKEGLDNSCDAIEWFVIGRADVTIHIIKDKDLLHIVIRNSNHRNRKTFTATTLERIYHYDRFHSTKSDQHTNTRGALGDAMKESPTMSYAQINNTDTSGLGEDKQWTYPTIIRHCQTEFKVRVHVNRATEKITPVFEPEIHDESIDGYTEVEFTLPLIPELKTRLIMDEIVKYCKKYTIFSTHINFEFHFRNKDTRESSKIIIPKLIQPTKNFDNCNSIYSQNLRDFQNFVYNAARSDPSETVYNALISRNFREARHPAFKSQLEILIGEGTTLGDLSKDSAESRNLIKQTFDLMRRLVPPRTQLDLAHKINFERKQQLFDRFNAIRPASFEIENVKNAQYRGTVGYVTVTKDGKLSTEYRHYINKATNDTALKFPFMFEIMAIPIIRAGDDSSFANEVDQNGLVFIGGVNYSITPVDSSAYFDDKTNDTNSYTFDYNGKRGDSVTALLRNCGYASDWYNERNKIDPKIQKQPSVIIMHLVSPNIQYLAGYGKGFINLSPYASTIAKAVVEVVHNMPSKAKYDKHLRNMQRANQGKPKDSVIFYERLLIKARWELIKQRPGWKKGMLYFKEWVQSSVWYNLNKQYLIPNQVPVTEKTRDYVTSQIRKCCAELEIENDPTWKVSREEVGITASTRAFLYFNGAWLAVDITKIEELAELGTDQVFIEKRGGIDQVTTSVGNFGIAFCNTQGHFVEYAEDLISAARAGDAHISNMTDFDCAGINIAERVMVRPDENDDNDLDPDLDEEIDESDDENFIERLGIDPFDTLLYFGLQREDVEQIYSLKLDKDGNLRKGKDGFELMNPSSNVTSPIVKFANKYFQDKRKFWRYKYIADELPYLLGTVNLRIMAKRYQSDNEKFAQYKYISDNLTELSRNAHVCAKRIEIDSVIEELSVIYGDGKGGEMFGNYIMDMLHICFPERNYNRANKRLTEYFGPKFAILPVATQRLFRHAVNIADAGVEDIENDIEREQENVNGFLNVSNKKKEDIVRLAITLKKDYDMKSLNSQIKKMDIVEYFDGENVRDIAGKAGLRLKNYFHGQFIMKHGTKEQKRHFKDGKPSTDAIYKEVLKQAQQKRKGKKKQKAKDGSEEDEAEESEK